MNIKERMRDWLDFFMFSLPFAPEVRNSALGRAVHRRIVQGRFQDAIDLTSGVGHEPLKQLAHAELLEKQGHDAVNRNDFSEATRLFSDALAQPVMQQEALQEKRAHLLICLANQSFNQGKPHDTVRYCEGALLIATQAENKFLSHMMAANGYVGLGLRNEEMQHRQAALKVAEDEKLTQHLPEALAVLASGYFHQGQLDKALELTERALQLPKISFTALTVRYECLKARGDFEAARQSLQALRENAEQSDPRWRQRLKAIPALAGALLESEVGNWQAMAENLGAARQGFAEDKRMTLWCDTAQMVLDANRGKLSREQVPAVFEAIEMRLKEFDNDRETMFICLSSRGRAALAVGDFERAKTLWKCYLEASPMPLQLPWGQFHYGEALKGAGDLESAREAYQVAVECGVETRYTGLSRERLAQF